MRELGPDRLSHDGTHLVARDPQTGEVFGLRIDDRLRRLLDLAQHRQRTGRPDGQLEITMESSLSPRDIQARIRRGESPESVAASAGVDVAQIEGFAGPVLAERAYVAEQARRTALRRRHVGGAGVAMGSLVDEHVVAAGGVPESVVWDAWRREDGRWTVTVRPEDTDETATFLFDTKSRYVLPADDAAHRLVGDIALPDSSDMAIADAVRSAPGEAVVPAAQVLAEQVLTDPVEAAAPHASVASLKEARDRRAMGQLALTDVGMDVDATPAARSSDPRRSDLDEPTAGDAAPTVPADEPARKKHERRRVPSWDEIMFGGKDG